MPLVRLSDTEAVTNRKSNAAAGWGERGSSNRVEPVAKPCFDVPFKIAAGEKIFTVGSCFARNVEGELIRLGFAVPVRELFRRADFANFGLEIINNYGTPSIFNEFAWAFGERRFEPEEHLLEVKNGRFADIHLSPTLRPEPWDVVLGRRQAIAEAYRLAATCSTVIMTLGLCEIWFDTLTGFYINVAPRPAFLTRFPGRFELHVLSFEEAHRYLEDSIGILYKNAPDIRIILTVSPVPLMATHRPMDVMVANGYSKSVLRACVDAVVSKYPFVTYYPSYESVMLTDRKIAWKQDLVHVTEEIVALNVSRMIDAFVGRGGDCRLIESESAAIEGARSANARGSQAGDAFFNAHGHWSERSCGFAMEHARYCLKRRQALEALRILAPYDKTNLDVAVVAGKALTLAGRAREAIALLDPLCTPKAKSMALWEALIEAAIAEGEANEINAVLWRYGASVPYKASSAYLKTAKWFHAHGDTPRARSLCQALAEMPLTNGTALELAEFLVELGELSAARESLARVAYPTGTQQKWHARLQAFLA